MEEIIMQLHAEEVATESTAEASQTSTQTSESNTSEVKAEGNNGTYGLKLDPRTGRPSVSFIAKQEPAKQEPTQQEQVQTTEETVQEQKEESKPLIGTALNTEKEEVKPYDASELVLAIQSGVVDESRIPKEYALQYAALKAQQNQQQAMQQQTDNQEEEIRQQQIFYQRIEDMAKKETLKNLGLTEEELVAAEYSDDEELTSKAGQYQTALAWNRSRIAEAIQREQYASEQAKRQQQAIYDGIRSYTADLQAKEPNFNAIDSLMQTYYKSLPYDEAVNVADAITALNSGNISEQQCNTLKDYYEKTRVAYYAKQNNLSTTPTRVNAPKVENGGSGANAPAGVTVDSLRNAKTMKEKSAIIAKLFLGR